LGFSIAIAWSTFATAGLVLSRVLELGTLQYQLGGWAAPWGIEYRIDALSAFVLLFVSGIGAVALSYAPASMAREIPEDRHYLFCAATLLCLTGLLGIAITGDLFNLFVFLEISSLSSYALISMGSSRRALTAALQYLILGTIGATFLLIGVGLLYMLTGTLNMIDMADRLSGAPGSRTVIVAFAFLTVGISLKMALFPLHLWLPNAYTYAPSVITAFLAATATKVAVYILLRFVFTVFGKSFAFDTMPLGNILLPLAILAILVPSTVAIFQTNIKRMLAYSSLAQIGYIVLGISFASITGLTAGIVHLFNHALMKGGMFLAMGCLVLRLGSAELADLRGVGRRMPWTMFAWVVGGLGLIGVPSTAGFISKWYLINAAWESGSVVVAGLVLFSSLLALVYVWRVVEAAYFQEPAAEQAQIREAPASMLIPTWVLIGATIVFGLTTSLTVGVAHRAAAALLRVAP
jgi:multicomponent Na+:H+ antiporter subunit D